MAGYVAEMIAKFGLDTKDAEKSSESLSERFEKMQHTLETIAGVELFRGAREVANIILEKLKGPSEYADRILSMSAAAGLGAEQLQKLQFSAQQNGVSAESASTSIVHLNRTLEGARTGSKEATKAFTALGISQEQVAGFKDSNEALMMITDQLKAMPDPIKRSSLAMQIFGRGGAAQLKWLAAGSEEMRKMQQRAEDLGAVVSSKDAVSLNEMGDIIESVGTALRGFVSTLTARVAPSIIFVVSKIEDWWIANRKLIQSGIEKWIDNFLYWCGYLTGIIMGVIGSILDWADAHKILFTWMKNVAEDAIVGLVKAIMGVVGWVRDFITNNQELVAGFIKVALAIGGVTLAVGLWEGLTATISGFAAALGAVRTVILAIDASMVVANLQIYAIAAAIMAVVVAADLAFEMLYQHKSFKDTIFGQLGGGIDGVVSMLSGKKAPSDGSDASAGGGFGPSMGFNMATAGGGVANLMSMNNLAAKNQDASSMAAASFAPDVNASMPPQNISLSMPFSVTAPAGADPQAAAIEIQKHIDKKIDTLMSQAGRATKPNVRH